MKKFFFLIIITLTLFLFSCNIDEININLDYKDGQYELVTQEQTIDLKQYITYSKIYLVQYQGKDYSSNDPLTFELNDGFNNFIVKARDIEYIISVIKEYDCKVNIVDETYQIIETFDIKFNKLISKELIDENKYVLSGYTWDGTIEYSKDNKTFEKSNINDLLVHSDLFIKMSLTPNDYVITLIIGNEQENLNIKMGEKINIKDPEKEGYEFKGWLLDGKKLTQTTYEFDHDIELVAKFEPKQFTITYTNIDEPFTQTVKYDNDVSLYTPSKKGYEFKGWKYNNELFNIEVWNLLTDIELVAVWEEAPIKVNLEAFGGELSEEVKILEDGSIVLPTPNKQNYIFKYWCNDKNLKNEIKSLNIENYNGETLYAYYEYNSDYLKDQTVVTMFNNHSDDYKDVVMFDKSQTDFTSLYWHKIGITNNEEGYFVSGIAQNGDKLSTLGEYDYVLLAYANYPYYNKFVNMDCYVGYEVKFIVDPSDIDTGQCINIISFIGPELTPDLSKVKQHLESIYGDYKTIDSNINLLKQYNNFSITWKTSNREIVSTKGVYKKPYMTRDVTLSAYIGEDLIYKFTVNAKGETDTSTALSTGYIYTPYNTITQNAMDMLDIIYIAFLEIDDNGDWTNYTRVKNNINNYIREKAEKAGTKIVVSVNQSTSKAFPTVAADATLREKLANNIVQVIKDLDLDGVDIDWETPTSSEAPTFTLMMKEIYTKVKAENEDYLVTAAIGGGKWQPPKYDLPNSGKYLDYVNLMTYSMTTGNAYYQNSLYPSTKKSTLVSCSIDESVKLYNNLGIENNKILVGIPFYVTVQSNCEGPSTQTGTGKSKWYSVLFSDYKLSATMKEYFDEECGVPYRYDATNKIFISYDNEESIKVKCEYINTLGLAGIMYWQYGQDVDDMLTNAIKNILITNIESEIVKIYNFTF